MKLKFSLLVGFKLKREKYCKNDWIKILKE